MTPTPHGSPCAPRRSWGPSLAAFALAAALLGVRGAPGGTAAAGSADGTAAPQTADLIQQLNGTRWTVELRPAYQDEAGQQDAPLSDTLQYDQGRVTSAWLGTEGYTAASITVTQKPDGTPVWEALQLNEHDGLAFWRGELDGEEMRGVLSRYPLERPGLDFLFVGRIIPSAAAPEAPALVPAETDTPKTKGSPFVVDESAPTTP